jgi:hypothetical protein
LTCANNCLEIADALQRLEITATLCGAYDRLTAEGLSLYKLLRQEVSKQQLPARVLYDTLRLLNSPKLDKLMLRVREKVPLLHDYVLKLKGLTLIENLLQGEVTDAWLQKRRQQMHDRLTQAGMPYELIELFLKRYQRRPRKRPASKATKYLQALDFKNANPQTSWGKLARKFCGDPSQANTLKAWAYRKKNELAEIGVQIRLDNPDYQRMRPRQIRKRTKS